MLNMKTEFTEQDINDIKIFRSGTVFKLEGWANDVLVLKRSPRTSCRKRSRRRSAR